MKQLHGYVPNSVKRSVVVHKERMGFDRQDEALADIIKKFDMFLTGDQKRSVLPADADDGTELYPANQDHPLDLGV